MSDSTEPTAHASAPATSAPASTDEVRIRRAPKLSAFMIVGGGLGAIVTFVLTNLFPVDPQVGFAALFGYFALYGVTAGVLVGALIALVIDRVGLSRARSVTVERETIVTPEPEAPSN
jgi:hypothetical protein